MAELTFLRDSALVMAVSAVTTVVFHLLRQPVVLGYIVAGVIIGPHTPPFSFVTDLRSIQTLAELGVLLLLFSIGLEFDLRKLRRVGGVALFTELGRRTSTPGSRRTRPPRSSVPTRRFADRRWPRRDSETSWAYWWCAPEPNS